MTETLVPRANDTYVPDEITTDFLRDHLSDALESVLDDGSRIYITYANKRVAALVPADEAEWLDAREDAKDLRHISLAVEPDERGFPAADAFTMFADDMDDMDGPDSGHRRLRTRGR